MGKTRFGSIKLIRTGSWALLSQPLSLQFASNLNLALTFLIVGPQEGETAFDLLDFSLDLGTVYIGAD